MNNFITSVIMATNIIAISFIVNWITLLIRKIKLDRKTSIVISLSIYWLILVTAKGGFILC